MVNQRWQKIALMLPMLLVAWVALPSTMWAETLTIKPAVKGGSIEAVLKRAQPGDVIILRPELIAVASKSSVA